MMPFWRKSQKKEVSRIIETSLNIGPWKQMPSCVSTLELLQLMAAAFFRNITSKCHLSTGEGPCNSKFSDYCLMGQI